MNKITVQSCRFKRTQTSAFEVGVMLGHGDLILDAEKRPVKHVWTYTETPHEGCFVLYVPTPPAPKAAPAKLPKVAA